MEDVVVTGISGLDYILNGGVPRGSNILIDGAPGTGKTTFGMQFLIYGANHGEPGIYISFEELPARIYRDMQPYGWDLEALEAAGQFAIVSVSPDTFFQQLLEVGGIIDNLLCKMNCRRIVIDSLTMLSQTNSILNNPRAVMYTLCSGLRRHGITALLIHEGGCNHKGTGFEHFVADGTIHLSIREHRTYYRKHTLEVTKMRGRKYIEGEHPFKFTSRGVVLPAAIDPSTPAFVGPNSGDPDHISTGIPDLDTVLQGGLAKGSRWLLDTDNIANHWVFSPAVSAQRMVMAVSPDAPVSLVMEFMRMHGYDVSSAISERRLFFVELYERRIPDEVKDVLFDMSRATGPDFMNFFHKTVVPLCTRDDDPWFWIYDVNSFIALRGEDAVMRHYPEIASVEKDLRCTSLMICNSSQVTDELRALRALFERSVDGIIRTWVEGRYQYLQVAKSPSGIVTEPMVVVRGNASSSVRLI